MRVVGLLTLIILCSSCGETQLNRVEPDPAPVAPAPELEPEPVSDPEPAVTNAPPPAPAPPPEPQSSISPEQEKYQTTFQRKAEDLDAHTAATLLRFEGELAKRLDGLEAYLKQQGDLDSLVFVRDSRQAFTGLTLESTFPPGGPEPFVKLCAAAAKYLQRQRIERAGKDKTLHEQMIRTVETLKKTLVRANRIPEAVEAENLLKTHQARVVELAALMPAPEVKRPPGPRPPVVPPRLNAGLPKELREGLVLHFSAETKSKALKDLSGKKNDGHFYHGAKWDPDGIRGGALRFDGEDDYVKVDYDDSLAFRTEASFAAWCRIEPREGDGDRGDYTILSRVAADNTMLYYVMVLSLQRDRERLRGVAEFGNNQYGSRGRIRPAYNHSRAVIADGEWHHLVVVLDGDEVRFFVDGRHDDDDPVTGELDHAEGDLKLGVFRTGRSYSGLLDELCLYDRPLSYNEVKALYKATGPKK